MSLRIIERWVCDDCGVREETDDGDGPPETWEKNIDDEDFCPKCALTLDPHDAGVGE